MSHAVGTDFAGVIAQQIEAAHQVLALQWLQQLKQVLPVAAHDIFPGHQLLDQIPALIQALATFLRSPADDAIASNAVITTRATELGQLRHQQQASVHQVVREYHLLRTVIAQFVQEETARLGLAPGVGELFEFANRLNTVIDVLLQTTLDTFVGEYTNTITQHTAQLQGFNRMASHELRQPLNTLQVALKLLAAEDTWMDRGKRDRFIETAERNVARMSEMLGKLVALSRSPEAADNALVQRVDLTTVTTGVVNQLREMAEARGVDIRIASPLPKVTIDVARLELILVNLISNAIKYSDRDKPIRFVEIAAASPARPDACAVSIRDNGLGIAERDLRSIFARFYRGHAERDRDLGTSGLGLGLSIVADCVEALKGDIRVESTLGEGTTFFLELPLEAAA